MKRSVRKMTLNLTFSAVIAALGVGVMLLSAVIPVGIYALPCIAGALIVSVLIECGAQWALAAFAVTSVLSLIFTYDKEAVILFIAFFGYYPVLKELLESRLSRRAVRLAVKLFVFNLSAVASFFAAMWLLSVPAEEYTLFGVYLPWVFLIAGNLLFLLYDRALTVFTVFYRKRLHGKLLKLR